MSVDGVGAKEITSDTYESVLSPQVIIFEPDYPIAAEKLTLINLLPPSTSGIRDRAGPGQLVPYIRMSLITDGNYVHFRRTDRKIHPS